MSPEEAKDIAFLFGPFRLVPSRQLLIRDHSPVKIGSRALDILRLLLMRAGEEVSKSTLIEHAWPNVFVDDANLKVHISGLRRALQDTIPQPTYIATIPGRGYQFIAPVRTAPINLAEFSHEPVPVCAGLPASSTLIGRQSEIQVVARALDSSNLVTLVGPGGVGKTSIAVEVAHARRQKHPDGVHFVDLAGTSDPMLVPHLVATCLGLRMDAEALIPCLRRHFKEKRVLIVLDNCEHLLHATAAFASQLTAEKMCGRLLATSREPLGLPQEHLQKIEPLSFPQSRQIRSAADALRYPAIELFTLRGLESSDFHLADADAQSVASLCEALDGLPLAIEIAAAKLKEFSPAAMLESLNRRLMFRRGGEDGPSRQRTLWATLDWSYQLLSSQESTLFRLLSVFAGAFEWPEVVWMSRLPQYSPYHTTIALSGLVAKSLVSADLDGENMRYQLLVSARDFAADHLENDPYAREAHRLHALCTLAAMEQAEKQWSGVETGVWWERYGRRAADVRKALAWCFGSGGDTALGVDLATAAIRLWNEQSSVVEQLTQVDRALKYCASLPDGLKRKAPLATSRAWGLLHARRLKEESDDAWNMALQSASANQNSDQLIAALCGQAIFLVYTGRCEEALSALDHLLRVAEQVDDRPSLFDVARLRAFVSMHLGCLLQVRPSLERMAEELVRGVPSSRFAARYGLQRYVSIHTTLALTNWLTGRPKRAQASIVELVAKTGQANQLIGQAHVLALFALPLALLNRDIDALVKYSAMLGNILDAENLALWSPSHRFYEAFARRRRDARAIAGIRAAIEEMIGDRFLVRTPMCLAAFAEALLEAGEHVQAREAIELSMTLQLQSNENWCAPELLRVRASVASQLGDRPQARVWLDRAREEAVRIGACSLELRIVNDIATMALRDGDHKRAMALLMPVLESIEERESNSHDLRTASRLIAIAHANPKRSAISIDGEPLGAVI